MTMLYSNNSSSTYTFLRHCEERLSDVEKSDAVEKMFTGNERRGNLPSLSNWREFFGVPSKITLQQTQSREIASRMQQRLTSFAFHSSMLRLAMTNESGWFRLRQCKQMMTHTIRDGA